MEQYGAALWKYLELQLKLTIMEIPILSRLIDRRDDVLAIRALFIQGSVPFLGEIHIKQANSI